MTVNKVKTVKCKNCEKTICETKYISKITEREIYVKNYIHTSIKQRTESRIAKCVKCKKLLGIILSTKNEIMIYKEKIKIENAN